MISTLNSFGISVQMKNSFCTKCRRDFVVMDRQLSGKCSNRDWGATCSAAKPLGERGFVAFEKQLHPFVLLKGDLVQAGRGRTGFES